MTLKEVELKVATLEAELILLRHEILTLKGDSVLRGFGSIGTFQNDPTFLEAARLGRSYRNKVNRDSLKELAHGRTNTKVKKKPKKTNARP